MDSYEIYVVQAGDTLFGIASRFDLTIAESKPSTNYRTPTVW